MHPSQSLNTAHRSVDPKDLDQRTKLYAAQRASQPLTFHPKDGSAPLRAWALNEAGDGWWDIIVDNFTVEDGTPHRIFETRSRMAGPLDNDVRGLFSVGSPTSPTNAPIPPTEQVARTTAGHAAYKAALLGAQMGSAAGVGMYYQRGAPSKMFSREEVLAVIRADLATLPAGGGEEVLARRLLMIFGRME